MRIVVELVMISFQVAKPMRRTGASRVLGSEGDKSRGRVDCV